MKVRNLVLFTVLMLALAIFIGCASSGGGDVTPIGNATGTATAKSQGFSSEISVTITMANGIITDVVVTGDETPSIGDVAIMRAPGMIKRSNSADLDAISGSSFTTAAISEAAQAAIDEIVAKN